MTGLAWFYGNCKKNGMVNMTADCRAKVNGLLLTLYLSSILIATRTIFRIVDSFEAVSFNSWHDDELKWGFWVFEASLMLLNTVMLNFRHPAKYLPKLLRTYLGEDGAERDGRKFL